MTAGQQKLDGVKDEDLPDTLRAHEARSSARPRSTSNMAERKALNERMAELVRKRDQYVTEQRKNAPGQTGRTRSTARSRKR